MEGPHETRGRKPKSWPAAPSHTPRDQLFRLTQPPRAGAPDFTRGGYRVWIIEADWYLVEREPSAAPLPDCWSVILDQHGVIYCTCPSGLQRIGCEHILAVGEQPQRELADSYVTAARIAGVYYGEDA